MALRRRRCNQNTRRNNLRFLHGTATYGNLQKTSNQPFPGVPPSPLQINGVTMERVDNYRYLGVWITSNLSWNKHIPEVCHKARQKVGILYRKCYKNANNATMLKLYLSCIRPELEYAASVWSPHQKGQIDTLEHNPPIEIESSITTPDLTVSP